MPGFVQVPSDQKPVRHHQQHLRCASTLASRRVQTPPRISILDVMPDFRSDSQQKYTLKLPRAAPEKIFHQETQSIRTFHSTYSKIVVIDSPGSLELPDLSSHD